MTVDDSRALFATLLNHIPPTMQASRLVMSIAAAGGEGDGALPQTEQVLRELGRQLTALNVAVMVVENRLELADGRPGLPQEAMVAISSEFGF